MIDYQITDVTDHSIMKLDVLDLIDKYRKEHGDDDLFN